MYRERIFVILNNYCYDKISTISFLKFPVVESLLIYIQMSISECPCRKVFVRFPSRVESTPKTSSCSKKNVSVQNAVLLIDESIARLLFSQERSSWWRVLLKIEGRGGRMILILLLSNMMQCGRNRTLLPATYQRRSFAMMIQATSCKQKTGRYKRVLLKFKQIGVVSMQDISKL